MWTLIVWVAVAVNGVREWRPMVTNLQSEEACIKASYKFTQTPDRSNRLPFRCIGPQG